MNLISELAAASTVGSPGRGRVGGRSAGCICLTLMPLDLTVQEHLPALRDIHAAGLYILCGSGLGMNGFELALHRAGHDQCGEQADADGNQQTPYHMERPLGEGPHIIRCSCLCLCDKLIAQLGVGIKCSSVSANI